MEYELYPSTEEDKEIIRTLSDRCYRQVVELQFGGWDVDLQVRLFEEKWNASRYQKIFYRGEMVGVLEVETYADHILLSEIQIDPNFQGKGLGTIIMSDVIEKAKRLDIPIKLEVLIKNRAKELYERLGFKVIDMTDTHFAMEKGA